MDYAISEKTVLNTGREREMKRERDRGPINLANAKVNKEYTIKDVKVSDEELRDFLFTLGCYAGEKVSIISILGENYVITVKDARYSIDKGIAEAIVI